MEGGVLEGKIQQASEKHGEIEIIRTMGLDDCSGCTGKRQENVEDD